MAKGESEAELRKDLQARLSTITSEQQERLARRKAETLGLPYFGLVLFPLDPDVLGILPKSIAEKASAVVFYRQGRDARLGAVNPRSQEFEEARAYVEKELGFPPQVHVISLRSLETALSRYRTEREGAGSALHISEEDTQRSKETIQTLSDLGHRIERVSPTELLTTIVSGAVRLSASDVHIEPAEGGARLRYRIDGVLQDVTQFARTGWRMLLSRVKVMAKLKLNVRDLPQDGSFVLDVEGESYDIRVSILPGGDGENIVMRVLPREAHGLGIEDLGLRENDLAVIREELKRSSGMTVVTGPTGSGKTTTLAAFIEAVNDPAYKIITLEDPIEYRIPGVEHTQVDTKAGYTFAKGLRALLRQDPDIVMVGEIRDEETVATALNAAMTGHVVFTTLHTNNAPESIVRLTNLGAEPYIVAPALNVIVAQRLVRRVCGACAQEYTPEPAVLDRVRDVLQGISSDVANLEEVIGSDAKVKKAGKCEDCGNSGYRGRIGLFEVMVVHGELEELVLAGAPAARIRETAMAAGMTTILQDGYLKALEGITTLEEVDRVTQE